MNIKSPNLEQEKLLTDFLNQGIDKKININQIIQLEKALFTKNLTKNTISHIVSLFLKKQKHYSNLQFLNTDMSVKEMKLYEILAIVIKEIIEAKIDVIELDELILPNIIMIIGLNGTGKTSMVGKICRRLQENNWNPLVVSCDTFRQGALTQLVDLTENFGEVFINKSSKPNEIVKNALNYSTQKKHEVVILDTAGRSQNDSNLVNEIIAIQHICLKFNKGTRFNTLLNVDLSHGFNCIKYIQSFLRQTQVDGLVLSKFDLASSARTLINIASEIDLPIYSIGDGESSDRMQNPDPDTLSRNFISSF